MAVASTLHCLSIEMVEITVNGAPMQALVDTESSDNFTSTLLFTMLENRTVSWIHYHSLHQTDNHTHEHCCNCLTKVPTTHISSFVLSNLCANVLPGPSSYAYAKRPITFGGENESFSICNLTTVHNDPPPMFSILLPNCNLTVTKYRRYFITNERFIKTEIDYLQKEQITGPSNSPWRARVLVTTGERHKRRIEVDYSQTGLFDPEDRSNGLKSHQLSVF